ncbi:serine protease inhibitor 77Ba-like [Onthophagus taurus]|uniref:serine protease inhibitor 77Ba-like n=1 Tax=Onthophagus taurus TaxID=166361 RepID=UPI000C2051A1|nr:serine protease inhibitor 77Ba-like [Onthophagus taurus]
MALITFIKRILLFFVFVTSINCQNADDYRLISDSLDRFSLNFLAETCKGIGESRNLALSPQTIWSLMAIVTEGARNNTAKELEYALGIPASEFEKDRFRKLYRRMSDYFKRMGSSGVTLEYTNSIFVTDQQNLLKDFSDIARNYYDVDITPVDFRNVRNAVSIVNKKIEQATRGKINNLANEGDLMDAQLFITSVLFFKGLWKNKFNVTDTRRESFYDERGNAIGEVNMMFQVEYLPFSLILDNTATAVELPYQGDRVSMIVILPKKNIMLQSVLQDLAAKPFQNIIATLKKAAQSYMGDPVMVSLPRFKVDSDLTLNSVLNTMGIRDVFNEDTANLLGIFPHYVHLSRVIQKAHIEVDEEGTVATAASGAGFQYKTPPPKFIANKPFAYIIYDKLTEGIIFAGKISNPDGI